MFRQALRELRFHPGRLVATLLAIALSVGFMSAVSIFMATQTAALGKMLALPTSKADLVVQVNDTPAGYDDVRAALAGVPGVEAVEQAQEAGLNLNKDGVSALVTVHVLPGERFRWAQLTSGRWPASPTEIALSQQVADDLRARIGDRVDAGPLALTVSGITDDAPTLFLQTAYAAAGLMGDAVSGERAPHGTWLIGLRAGADAAGVRSALDTALAPYRAASAPYPDAPAPIVVSTPAEAQHAATTGLTSGFDVMKNMLLAFSAIAALVGLIIIANTFTILLAQRRRQIGLLRAVGASGGQVRSRFLAEAAVLGLVGSLIGVVLGTGAAWIGALITKASWFGLVFPWPDLAAEVAIGVLLTVLAAMLPALRATRVAPLEALQPVATSEQVRRASRVRAAVTGLLLLAGVALAVASQVVTVKRDDPGLVGPVLFAITGAMLITVGVLGAAPLYVPALMRGLGRLVGSFGATARLAGENAVRNPSRASATATALMLATGLIVTLQIGVATAQRTVLTEIERTLPIDLTVATTPYGFGQMATDPQAPGQQGGDPQPAPRLSPEILAQVATLPNVAASVVISGGVVTSADQGELLVVLGADPSMRRVSEGIDPRVADGVLLTSSSLLKDGSRVTLSTTGGAPVTVTVQRARWVPLQQAIVSPATLATLVPDPQPQAVWMKLADKQQVGATMQALERITAGQVDVFGVPKVMTGGSAMESYLIQQVLSLLLLITTALLGVAVLIALIGVGNTLGLSVLERARESALLRALGMQRGSLRLMLLIEALLLALTGVLVGVAAGVFFGWLGMSAVLRQASIESPVLLGVDWAQTLGLLGIAVAAAALASVLPGRRAANATPTEALAAD